MAEHRIVPLGSIVLDLEAPVLRDYTRPEANRSEEYLQKYDRTTLVYDCVWRPDLNAHIINAPLFLNLWEPFQAGLRRNGQPISGIKRKTWKRSEWVVIPGPREGLTLNWQGTDTPLPSRDATADFFKGMNAVIAVNKDNQLNWISDWMRFNVACHGAEAVAIFDNASTTYTPEELAACLSGVPGLKRVIVYPAPFSYGPMGGRKSKREKQAKFFQSAMINIARADCVAESRAVLSVDVDELVTGPEGTTVFDAAVKNPLGMVSPMGFWAYPEYLDRGPADHGAHRFRSVPNPKYHRKWCLTPQGFIGRTFLWDQQQIGGALQNWFTMDKRFEIVHCRGCSTGWRNKRFELGLPLERDPALETLMDTYFPGSGQN